MSATNCPFNDALAILILLWEKYLADAYILVYYRQEAEQPIQRRPLTDGFPKLPLVFEVESGEQTIYNPDEIFYRFEFDLKREDIQIAIHELR